MPVDAHAGGIEEDPPVHLPDVDPSRARLREEARELPSPPRIAERPREVVAGPDRIQRQRDLGVDETVGDLVRGAVATDCDDPFVAVLDRGAGQARSLARGGRRDDVGRDARGREIGRDAPGQLRTRALPRDGVHDRERARPAHDAGVSAFLIASCSSSESG